MSLDSNIEFEGDSYAFEYTDPAYSLTSSEYIDDSVFGRVKNFNGNNGIEVSYGENLYGFGISLWVK